MLFPAFAGLNPTSLRLVALGIISLTACKYPYPGDPIDADDVDGPLACQPSTTSCTDDALIVCDQDGHPSSTTPCAFGCPATGARCADLAPSNGLTMYLDQASAAAPVVLTGSVTIDTDAVTINGSAITAQTAIVPSAPVDILVIIAGSFEANDVSAHGSRALAIMSNGDVRLHGTLSVSASHQASGAGAGELTDPSCTARRGSFSVMGYGGGGGGGFGTAGGRGGNGGTVQGGTRGEAAGNAEIVPLRGGCPGAQASGLNPVDPGAQHGGAGGGALQISTRGRITLDATARIVAVGGGAKGIDGSMPCPYTVGDSTTCDAGSGGGAGGAILLEAAKLEMSAAAALVANGGAGTCGLHGLAPDGTVNENAAQGTSCSGLTGVGDGGNGGAGAIAGFNGSDGTANGGGAGGGAGRIRINLPRGVVFDPGPPIVSPVPSLGTAPTR